MSFSPPLGVFLLTHVTIDACSSTYAEDIMLACLYDRVIRNAPPTLVGYLFFGEVRWIIVIPANEQNPVICFLESAGHPIIIP